jgi:hypothetical protein
MARTASRRRPSGRATSIDPRLKDYRTMLQTYAHFGVEASGGPPGTASGASFPNLFRPPHEEAALYRSFVRGDFGPIVRATDLERLASGDNCRC